MLLNNAEAPKAVLLLPVVLSQSANPSAAVLLLPGALPGAFFASRKTTCVSKVRADSLFLQFCVVKPYILWLSGKRGILPMSPHRKDLNSGIG
jgi:hypothetical protein